MTGMDMMSTCRCGFVFFSTPGFGSCHTTNALSNVSKPDPVGLGALPFQATGVWPLSEFLTL